MPVSTGTATPVTWTLGSAGTVVLTVTAPDGTTTTPAVTGSSTYTATVAPIVSLADIRSHLRMSAPGAAEDQKLLTFARAASAACERYTDRVWRRTEVTAEAHTGGRSALILYRQPVWAVTAVTEDGSPLTSGWWLDPVGWLLRRGTPDAPWCWDEQVTVTYTAGPTGAVPDPVHLGVLEMVRHLQATQRGGTAHPAQGGGDEWDPREGFAVPRRVTELWDQVEV